MSWRISWGYIFMNNPRRKNHIAKWRRKENFTGFLFTLPALLGMMGFFFFPFCLSIGVSFTNGFGDLTFVGFRNYATLFGNPTFQLAAYNTARFIFTAVLSILVLSVFLSLLLQKKQKGHEFFRVSFLFPLVLPTASIILFFQLLFSVNGLFDVFLERLGIPVSNWLHSPYAFYVLVLLYVWKNFGYNVILFSAAFSSIPPAYYEVAQLEGISEWRKFFKITLPMTLPYWLFIIVSSIISAFSSFREAFILGGEHPHSSIYMLQHFINNNFQNLQYVRVVTASILIFSVIFLFVFFMLKFRNRYGDIEL